MDTKSIAVMLSNRKVLWGGGLALSFGLIGLPLAFMGISPWVDHSPWDANLMVLAAGVALCLASYIAGRICIATFTRDRITPPGRAPYIAAIVSAFIAIVCLVITAS